MLLVKKGLKVQSCSSGEETLDLVCNKKKEFDIIFMDNTMPGLVIYTYILYENLFIVFILFVLFELVWHRDSRKIASLWL